VTAPLVPTVTLELGGKQRSFRLDMNALCRYEREMHVNALRAETWQTFESRAMTATELRALLWACLAPEKGEELSVDDVGLWLTPDNMAEVASALAGLRAKSVPEAAEATVEAAPKQDPFGET
jgi:hypothetical protein